MYDLTTIAEHTTTTDAGRAAAAQPARSAAGLAAMIERIGETIDGETAGIRAGGDGFDIKASNARKSRHLYELSKAIKGVQDPGLLAEHADAIRGLREKLAVNERAILAHMSAVSEVAELIQGAIQRAEADGTYSAQEFSST